MSIFSHIKKAKPQEWVRDIAPRLLAIAIIITSAWAMANFHKNDAEDEWLDTLENNSIRNAKILNKFFNEKITLARNLAEDNRITTFLEEETHSEKTNRNTRRALYEFQYNNEIDNAYIYNAKNSTIASRTRGAFPFPETDLIPFYQASTDRIEFVQNIISLDDNNYFLFSHAIYDELGEVSGYAIYLESLHKILSDMNILSKKTKNVTYTLARINADGGAFVIQNFLRLSPLLSKETPATLKLPIFDNKNFIGLYQEAASEVMVGAIRLFPDHTSWSITSSIPQSYLKGVDTEITSVAGFIAFILSLILMLIPLNGPYSSHLRAIYFMVGIGKNLSGLSKSELKRLQEEPEEEDDSPVDWGNIDDSPRAPTKKAPAKKVMSIVDRTPGKAEIAYAIRTGMKKRSIKLLYQPIIDTQENTILSNEVFLQIIDETGSVLSPTLWLPIAEKEHLFQLIDETVAKVAVEKHYQSDSISITPLSFNISGDAFESFDFMKELMGDTAIGKRLANNTIFELRSREMLSDKRSLEFIRECRAGGFRFASDYLGGDESTVEATKKLKFDFLKIDISRFDITDKASLTTLVKIIKRAKKVNLNIIIEKVENEEMALILKKLGIRYMQGYYFGKPEEDIATR